MRIVRTPHTTNRPNARAEAVAAPRRPLAAAAAQASIAVAWLALATGLALVFRSVGITETSIVLIYLLSVVIASVTTGRLPGIVSSVVAVVLFNFLFTEPRFTFVVNDPQYLVTFPVMLTVAAISSELTARIRRQAEEAQRRERLTTQLYRASRALLGAQGRDQVIRAAVDHLSKLVEREVFCAVDDESDGVLFLDVGDRLSLERIAGPARELLDKGGTPPAVHVEDGDERWTLVPVRAQSRTLAVLAVRSSRSDRTPVDPVSLRAMVVQLALALDREEMSRREENARIEIERERLRSNLLQSISHDLRSPLASIVGSSTTLLAESHLTAETKSDLVASIRDDARWLAALVENLLSLTRAEESAVRLRGSIEVLDDVLAAALSRIERIHETHVLQVDPGAAPVLLRMDSGLIEQLILNLLENTIQHTPHGTIVRVSLRREGSEAVLRVDDNGPGLSNRALEHAFERFYTERAVPDARRGLGLGLSICRSIVEAHGGRISVSNRAEGGARFEARLPIEPGTDEGGDGH